MVADLVDQLLAAFSTGGYKLSQVSTSSRLKAAVFATYAAFALVWWVVVCGIICDTDFSSVLTIGATIQCLGFVLLCVKVNATNSVEGLSSKTLVLFVLFLFSRLTSTCIKNGYIPVDSTGDYFYQVMDATSLACVLHLLYRMHHTHVYTYQEEYDQLSVGPLVLSSVVLGIFIHGNFNRSQLFDTIWATSLNLETVTMLPQLAMLARIGGKVDLTTCHWIVCIVLSCVFRFEFWYYAHGELDWSIAGYHILIAHVVQLLLCGDFVFYYFKSWINWSQLILPVNGDSAY